jgi:hypothetical protein
MDGRHLDAPEEPFVQRICTSQKVNFNGPRVARVRVRFGGATVHQPRVFRLPSNFADALSCPVTPLSHCKRSNVRTKDLPYRSFRQTESLIFAKSCSPIRYDFTPRWTKSDGITGNHSVDNVDWDGMEDLERSINLFNDGTETVELLATTSRSKFYSHGKPRVSRLAGTWSLTIGDRLSTRSSPSF